MQVETEIDYTITTNTPCLYCSSKESNIIKDLQTSLVGKCYQGVYVLDILKIIQTSQCRAILSNAYAKFIIEVRFLASALVCIDTKTIIPKSKLCISGQYWAADNQDSKGNTRAIISFRDMNVVKGLPSGVNVPVIVYKSSFPPGQPRFKVSGRLLIPTQPEDVNIFKLTGHIPKNDIYNKLIDKILKQDEDIKNPKAKFFIELFTTYSKPKKVENYNVIDIIQQKTNLKDMTGNWTIDLHSSPEKCNIVKTSDAGIGESNRNAIIYFLEYFYSMRQGIIDMSKEYDEREISSNYQVWTLIRTKKL